MGRTKSYERVEVIDRALELFREQGYAGTSIDEIVKGTGINRYALYDEFGDKRGLFLAALSQFKNSKLDDVKLLLGQPGPKVPLIRQHLENVREHRRKNMSSKCLVTSSAVTLASSDPEVAARVMTHYQAMEAVFVEVLTFAKESGEIEPEVEIRALARAIMNAARGLRVIAGLDAFDEIVDEIIETTLLLLRPRVAFQNDRSE